MHTNLLYMSDAYTYEGTATIMDKGESVEGEHWLALDQTIFYPQGGGQPSDKGIISIGENIFEVQKVRFNEGVIQHVGTFTSGELKIGDQVAMNIDKDRRITNTLIHTAGHLVDVAMINIGYDFPPTKGYHFPDSPYVEYKGKIEADDRPEATKKLDKELERLISAGSTVKTETVNTLDEVAQLCPFVPHYIKEGNPIRIVTVAQNIGCPCGGTHIKNINELKRVHIARIKAKSGHTRVSYRVE
jgi:Ser-tRNA(Ala) deacylase AlaX